MQRDADPWSVASALMTLHTNADQQRTNNRNPFRPTASDIRSGNGRGPGHPPPAAAPPATTALAANATPIYGIIASDSDLLLPRFNGDRRVDADDCTQDFCAYVALRKISPTDAALLFRTRMTGAARTCCHPELMTEFWERRQGPDKKSASTLKTRPVLPTDCDCTTNSSWYKERFKVCAQTSGATC